MDWLKMAWDWQRQASGYLMAGLSLAAGLFSCNGCGGSGDPAKERDPNSSGDALPNDPAGLQAGAGNAAGTTPDQAARSSNNSNASRPGDSSGLTASGQDGAAEFWLTEEVRQATQLRRANRFQEESDLWRRVVTRLEASEGPGSWLAAGARLSQRVADRLIQLDGNQLRQWKTYENLETRFQQNRTEIGELAATERISQEQLHNALREQLGILNQQTEIIEDLFGQPSHLLANIAYHQAEVHMSLGQWVAAYITAEKCLVQRQATLQVRHPDIVVTLKLMGQIAQQMGNNEMAEDCLTKAAQQSEKIWGAKHLAYASHASDLGVFYYSVENRKASGQQKDFSKANHWLERALKVRQEALGEQHLMTSLSRRNYALSKMAEGSSKPQNRQALDLAVANAAIDQALSGIRQQTDADNRGLLLQVISEAATIKMLNHEFEAAESLLGELVQYWRDSEHPTDLPITSAALHYRLALACAKQQTPVKREKAQQLLQQAIRLSDPAEPGARADEKTLASAQQALRKLLDAESAEQEPLAVAGRGGGELPRSIPGTEPDTDAEQSPLRVTALPSIDDSP